MSGEPQLFRIDNESHQSKKMEEVEFARLGFKERRDIQEWIAANPGILDDDLLIISKEFSGFDRTNERLDLLAVDAVGRLVVIELKRDDSGSDAHWQAIKYASYLHSASAEDIIRMLASHVKMSDSDAENKLREHLDTDDLEVLNHDQRIILASHGFAPEVTSAALWLNEKTPGEALVTCVQLTPYWDAQADSLYVQSNTIIPVLGAEEYSIRIGATQAGDEVSGRGSKLARTFRRNKNDEVTSFLRRVADWVLNDLGDEVKPDKRSKWAGAGTGEEAFRYYHLWYSSRPHWSNWGMYYRVDLYQRKNSGVSPWLASVGLHVSSSVYGYDVKSVLDVLSVHDDQRIASGDWGCSFEVRIGGDDLDDAYGKRLAEALIRFIKVVTPAMDDFENELNEEPRHTIT